MEEKDVTELSGDMLDCVVGGSSSEYSLLENWLKRKGYWKDNINDSLNEICKSNSKLSNLQYAYVDAGDNDYFTVYNKSNGKKSSISPGQLLENLGFIIK